MRRAPLDTSSKESHCEVVAPFAPDLHTPTRLAQPSELNVVMMQRHSLGPVAESDLDGRQRIVSARRACYRGCGNTLLMSN